MYLEIVNPYLLNVTMKLRVLNRDDNLNFKIKQSKFILNYLRVIHPSLISHIT